MELASSWLTSWCLRSVIGEVGWSHYGVVVGNSAGVAVFLFFVCFLRSQPLAGSRQRKRGQKTRRGLNLKLSCLRLGFRCNFYFCCSAVWSPQLTFGNSRCRIVDQKTSSASLLVLALRWATSSYCLPKDRNSLFQQEEVRVSLEKGSLLMLLNWLNLQLRFSMPALPSRVSSASEPFVTFFLPPLAALVQLPPSRLSSSQQVPPPV